MDLRATADQRALELCQIWLSREIQNFKGANRRASSCTRPLDISIRASCQGWYWGCKQGYCGQRTVSIIRVEQSKYTRAWPGPA